MDVLFAILAFGGGVLLLYLICKIFAVPLKFLLKLVWNAIVGAIALILFNLVASNLFSFTVAVNPLNALIVGVLGVPGVILLIILTLIL